VGFENVSTADLLANKFTDDFLASFVQLFASTTFGTQPFWSDRRAVPEMIPNTAYGFRLPDSGGSPKMI
jgi:hypothetical protein